MPRILKKLFGGRDKKSDERSQESHNTASWPAVPIPSSYTGHTSGSWNTGYPPGSCNTGYTPGSYDPATSQGTIPTSLDESQLASQEAESQRKEKEHMDNVNRELERLGPAKAYYLEGGAKREIIIELKTSSNIGTNPLGISVTELGAYDPGRPNRDAPFKRYFHDCMVGETDFKDGAEITEFWNTKRDETCRNGIAWHLQPPAESGCISCMGEHTKWENLFRRFFQEQLWNKGKKPDIAMIDAAIDLRDSNRKFSFVRG
jgi:hypothetical protein